MARVKTEAKGNERAAKEVSADIRARMESKQSEREGRIIGKGQGRGQ